MDPAIFDDQYHGCENKMEKIITDGLLDKELEINFDFKSAWEEATSIWKNYTKANVQLTLPNGFKDKYGIAIVAYTGSIYSEFNEAARAVGTSRSNYMNNFHFKSFHYYLTMALRKLTMGCTNRKVYRGVKKVHFMPPKEGNELRFGQFTSTSSNKKEALAFGTDSFFEINACYGVPIAKFSQYPKQEEVLVLGNEVFVVKNFDQLIQNRFLLDSTQQTCSFFNCAYFEGQ
ncbi:hypothetical protein GDO86_018710 [Hymenochirus boettgeri]|uniref:NAD(P)(+)--arginine ADP-ribosyltransferase n=1 Tax=Hymenochirus boettgeri TaxID=247094 RepID=A0A8T2IJZ1_9PIPI|nr:hypothetical protein GDO86_018710 [Hymenochirus boettgeri]